MSGSTAVATKNMLGFIVFFQYLPRLFRIFPLTSQMVRNTGVLMETAWAGAAYNLLLYLLASHVSPLLFSLISSYTYTGSSDSLEACVDRMAHTSSDVECIIAADLYVISTLV